MRSNKIFISLALAKEFPELLDHDNVVVSEYMQDKNDRGEWIYLVMNSAIT